MTPHYFAASPEPRLKLPNGAIKPHTHTPSQEQEDMGRKRKYATEYLLRIASLSLSLPQIVCAHPSQILCGVRGSGNGDRHVCGV